MPMVTSFFLKGLLTRKVIFPPTQSLISALLHHHQILEWPTHAAPIKNISNDSYFTGHLICFFLFSLTSLLVYLSVCLYFSSLYHDLPWNKAWRQAIPCLCEDCSISVCKSLDRSHRWFRQLSTMFRQCLLQSQPVKTTKIEKTTGHDGWSFQMNSVNTDYFI